MDKWGAVVVSALVTVLLAGRCFTLAGALSFFGGCCQCLHESDMHSIYDYHGGKRHSDINTDWPTTCINTQNKTVSEKEQIEIRYE